MSESKRLPRVAVTGGAGFLGWHTAVRAQTLDLADPVIVTRTDFAEEGRLAVKLAGVDRVIHLAGVNRAESDEDLEQGNADIAACLAAAIPQGVDVVYANSIQQDLDNAYGRGKRRAAEILGEAVRRNGGVFTDVVLPNIFGEHGRPQYNSFVATFCDLIARGQHPRILHDREIPLLHAQEAAQVLLSADAGTDRQVRPSGTTIAVSKVDELLQSMSTLYATGDIPRFANELELDLFNTLRSFLFPSHYPIRPKVNADPRGRLWEIARGHGTAGQSFVSTTSPGQARGNHYHLRKIERFAVVQGKARIGLRRLGYDDVIYFDVSGDDPCFVDMPTMWVHNIVNAGDEDLLTVFWSDQLLDPDNPDQYPAMVDVAVNGGAGR